MIIDFERLKLSDIEDMSFELKTIVEGEPPMLIVDNFYADPYYIQQLALSLHFKIPIGFHTHAYTDISLPFSEHISFIHQHYTHKYWGISELELSISDRINRWIFHKSIDSKYSKLLNINRKYPHHDALFKNHIAKFISGVVFLTNPDFCTGGTGFFRHKATGITRSYGSIPLEGNPCKRLAESMHAASCYHHQKDDTEAYQTLKNSFNSKKDTNEIWELITSVAMKFNRLILFPSYVYHNPLYGLADFDGADAANKRLTQNFYIGAIKLNDEWKRLKLIQKMLDAQ